MNTFRKNLTACIALAMAFAIAFACMSLCSCAGTSADDGADPAVEQGKTEPNSSNKSSKQAGNEKTTDSNAVAKSSGNSTKPASDGKNENKVKVSKDGSYITKDQVAAYINQYGGLPKNYISKTKAKKAGWEPTEGNLNEVLPGMSIGGSVFYDRDDDLPDAKGRTWHECDINYTGGYRGEERLVYSNDGLIFYTDDHYETFEQLY